ncbi:pentapeptide repeat-containing protein [Bradyrhizobium sp. BWA-3-5]
MSDTWFSKARFSKARFSKARFSKAWLESAHSDENSCNRGAGKCSVVD